VPKQSLRTSTTISGVVYVRKLVEVIAQGLDGLGADRSVNLCQVFVDFVEEFQRDGAVTVGRQQFTDELHCLQHVLCMQQPRVFTRTRLSA